MCVNVLEAEANLRSLQHLGVRGADLEDMMQQFQDQFGGFDMEKMMEELKKLFDRGNDPLDDDALRLPVCAPIL